MLAKKTCERLASEDCYSIVKQIKLNENEKFNLN
jgi:hypothetical protein